MKSPERYAAFLFYVNDWLSATEIDLMTAGEERGYLRLLLHSWKSDDCGLPDDDRILAQLSKLGPAWKGKSGAALRAQFTARDGRLFNDRMVRERAHQTEVREARKGASRKGNAARWASPDDPKRIPNGTVLRSQNDPSSSSSSNLSSNTNQNTTALMAEWEEFKALYPAHRLDEESAHRAFTARDEDATAILAGLKLAVTSETWTKEAGKYVPKASRWIADGAYKDAARLPQQTKTIPSPYFDVTTITGHRPFDCAKSAPSQENTCDPATWARIVAGRKTKAIEVKP